MAQRLTSGIIIIALKFLHRLWHQLCYHHEVRAGHTKAFDGNGDVNKKGPAGDGEIADGVE